MLFKILGVTSAAYKSTALVLDQNGRSKLEVKMAGQFSLNQNQLKQFAPNSPVLAFRPEDSGSPQQDWCKHLQNNSLYRRELEEFAVLGDVVLRIADGIEAAPIDSVRVLSLEYAMKVLKDETDAKEFVRAARAIAAPDAGAFELEQIASFYYGEIRRRGSVSEILKEMGLLGIEMQRVVATNETREIEFTETEAQPQKLTVAEQRKADAARKNLPPLDFTATPNFDDEMRAIRRRIGQPKASKQTRDEFAEFYLDDDGKSLDELDAGFLAYEKLEQYDENGVVGFSMSSGQHAVVAYDFEAEVDASYLPLDARGLAREMSQIFVGYGIGGAASQRARRFVFAARIARDEMNALKKGFAYPVTDVPAAGKFSRLPFSENEFSEWLAARLDELYSRRVQRSARRITDNRAGQPVEFFVSQEVNPDYEEMQYVAAVCQILWNQMRGDFHLRSLRREAYQQLHTEIRSTEDTAEVARLKKRAYDEFKEQQKLSLKEFTALNTAAKSQEVRLADKLSATTIKTLLQISAATANRLRYLKFFLYNDASVQTLTRQEKQKLWDAIRAREAVLQAMQNKVGSQPVKAIQQPLFRQPNTQKQIVRVTPRAV